MSKDLFRDTPLRYLGYEVGEAWRALVPSRTLWFVRVRVRLRRVQGNEGETMGQAGTKDIIFNDDR